jgi:hypothetical protein
MQAPLALDGFIILTAEASNTVNILIVQGFIQL